jgi:S-adenosylmethionine/arginine decarboxylase-like enzyme
MNSKKNIKECIDKIILNTNMEAWGKPILKYSDLHNGIYSGYSVVQFIRTSSITMHFVNSEAREAYIDFFSCKNFDQKIVKKIVVDYFKPTKIKARFIKRSPP